MMVIVDVFEVLIVVDCFYKSGKLLFEVFNIMLNMVNENYLDRELFILFLEFGIWYEYVIVYLKVDKIDDVDILVIL